MSDPKGAAGSIGNILHLVRDGTATTRGEVMEVTGLSRSTVMARVSSLVAAGLVTEALHRGRSSGGRPPAALSFGEDAGVVLAADLGVRHGRLAVCNLAGEPLAERGYANRIEDGPEVVLGWVANRFDELLAEAGRDQRDVLALGLDVPGPVDVAAGRPVHPPIMPGWDGYPIAEDMTARYGAPTLVERDVNAMVLGEHRTQWPRLRHMVFLKVGTGIGLGVIAEGALVRGHGGRAGDIGHIRAINESDVLCTCGNRGCVGAVASGAALVRQLCDAGIEASSTADVVALVRAGEVDAIHRVREAGRLVGAALAAVISIVAPTAIIVGGSMAEAAEPLLAGIRESVYQRSSPLATDELRILTSQLGGRAGVVGSAVLALEHALSPTNVESLLARRKAA